MKSASCFVCTSGVALSHIWTDVPEKNVRHHSFGAFMGMFLLVRVVFAIRWTGYTWSGFADKRCPRGASDRRSQGFLQIIYGAGGVKLPSRASHPSCFLESSGLDSAMASWAAIVGRLVV